MSVLPAAPHAAAPHIVRLSAICLQKSRLTCQEAKLLFAQACTNATLTWPIVRGRTAFFESLSGPLGRGYCRKPFLALGGGTLTSSEPSCNNNRRKFVADCRTDPAPRNRVLHIRSPGETLTPRQHGEHAVCQ